MLVAMGCNTALLVKLADRLHDMRTLGGLPAAKRNRLAQETIDVWAPLANRLGVWSLKAQLEDLAFKQLYPTQVGASAAHRCACCPRRMAGFAKSKCSACSDDCLRRAAIVPHASCTPVLSSPPALSTLAPPRSTLSCARGWSRCRAPTCWWAWLTACAWRCSARASGGCPSGLSLAGVGWAVEPCQQRARQRLSRPPAFASRLAQPPSRLPTSCCLPPPLPLAFRSYHDLSGRPKHLWGVFKKMSAKGYSLGRINDVRGLRIIVDSKADCYRALRAVEVRWQGAGALGAVRTRAAVQRQPRRSRGAAAEMSVTITLRRWL